MLLSTVRALMFSDAARFLFATFAAPSPGEALPSRGLFRKPSNAPRRGCVRARFDSRCARSDGAPQPVRRACAAGGARRRRLVSDSFQFASKLDERKRARSRGTDAIYVERAVRFLLASSGRGALSIVTDDGQLHERALPSVDEVPLASSSKPPPSSAPATASAKAPSAPVPSPQPPPAQTTTPPPSSSASSSASLVDARATPDLVARVVQLRDDACARLLAADAAALAQLVRVSGAASAP